MHTARAAGWWALALLVAFVAGLSGSVLENGAVGTETELPGLGRITTTPNEAKGVAARMNIEAKATPSRDSAKQVLEPCSTLGHIAIDSLPRAFI